jgi:hypothetical protein
LANNAEQSTIIVRNSPMSLNTRRSQASRRRRHLTTTTTSTSELTTMTPDEMRATMIAPKQMTDNKRTHRPTNCCAHFWGTVSRPVWDWLLLPLFATGVAYDHIALSMYLGYSNRSPPPHCEKSNVGNTLIIKALKQTNYRVQHSCNTYPTY